MSKLVQSNRNKKTNSLSRGEAIKPKETFSIEKLTKEKIEPTTKNIPVVYTPKPASMKIDSEIRDKINALTIIGYADNQKEAVDQALTNLIETFPEELKRKYDLQFEALRERSKKRGQ